MTAPAAKGASAIGRKVGPLPVWGWAAAAVAVWFLFLRGAAPAAASSGVQTPVGPAAQQPASGQGTPADNLTDEQLQQLLQGQQASLDALLALLQSTSPYQATGSGGGGGSVATAGSSGAPPGSLGTSGPAAEPTGIDWVQTQPGIFTSDPGKGYVTTDAGSPPPAPEPPVLKKPPGLQF